MQNNLDFKFADTVKILGYQLWQLWVDFNDIKRILV